MPRKPIADEIQGKIIAGLKRGKKPIDLARIHKVSAGYIYSLRSSVKKASVDAESKATEVVKSSVVKKSTATKTTKAPTVKPVSLTQHINEQISLRENEISSLKSALSILTK